MGLAAKRFDIAVVDMRDDWGEEAAAALRSETETKTAYVKTDLRQRSDIEAMVARVIREFGVSTCSQTSPQSVRASASRT
jgi:NAD(P)-dependent dehydrogenase (short-subunit alcohol dehydrogenase family)